MEVFDCFVTHELLTNLECKPLALTLDNTDPLFALVLTPGVYLHHVEVPDQDPATGGQ